MQLQLLAASLLAFACHAAGVCLFKAAGVRRGLPRLPPRPAPMHNGAWHDRHGPPLPLPPPRPASQAGKITEEEAQELIDQFVMKVRLTGWVGGGVCQVCSTPRLGWSVSLCRWQGSLGLAPARSPAPLHRPAAAHRAPAAHPRVRPAVCGRPHLGEGREGLQPRAGLRRAPRGQGMGVRSLPPRLPACLLVLGGCPACSPTSPHPPPLPQVTAVLGGTDENGKHMVSCSA